MKRTLTVLAILIAPAAALAHPGAHELSESASTFLHFLLSGNHAGPVLAGTLGLAVYAPYAWVSVLRSACGHASGASAVNCRG